MDFRRSSSSSQSPSIDITPVVDVVFILLIFLVISTTFRTQEHAFSIDLPKATQGKTIGKLQRPTIFISGAGQIQLYRPDLNTGTSSGLSPVSSADELARRLLQLKQLDPKTTISIKADSGVPYQQVMDAVNACYSAGIQRVIFPYSPKKSAM